nr:probable protein phosphatase 2C 34 [Ipomoea trifida]
MAKMAKKSDLILRSSGAINVDGSRNFASVFSKRGEKGINQDCFIVWEVSGHCDGRGDTLERHIGSCRQFPSLHPSSSSPAKDNSDDTRNAAASTTDFLYPDHSSKDTTSWSPHRLEFSAAAVAFLCFAAMCANALSNIWILPSIGFS